MDIGKLMDIISLNEIDRNEVFKLIDYASKLDLTDEDNLREIIGKGIALTGKKVPKDKEDRIIAMVKKEGITPNLIKLLY